MTVRYPWHPLRGQEVVVYRRIRRGTGLVLEVRLASGVLKRLPAWMTQADVCETMAVCPKPVCDVGALYALRAQLDAWAGGRKVNSPATEDTREELSHLKGR